MDDRTAPGAEDHGRVVVTGIVVAGRENPSTTTLYLEEGKSIGIVGELLGEIQRLAGARLTVLGDSAPDQALRARHYAVLEVNGQKPEVGVVARSGESYTLARETGALELDSRGPAPLAELVGAKIWATGVLEGERLRVASYGIIRPK